MPRQAKHKSLYERFQEEYVAVKEPCKNRDGFRIRYVYYGTWYAWNLPETALRREKREMALKMGAAAALWVFTAACPSWLNSLPLVAFPAIAGLGTLLLALVGVGQFCLSGRRTTRSNFESADRRLRLYLPLYLLSSAIAGLGSLGYLLRYGLHTAGVAVLAGNLAQAALAGNIHARYRSVPGTREENDVLRHVELAMSDQ